MPRKYKINKQTARNRARKAGQVTSERKAASSRANVKKGGKPANPAIQRIRSEMGCSRAWASELFRRQKPVTR